MKIKMSPFENHYKHERFFVLLDRLNVKPWHWISLSLLVAGADLLSGAIIQFPILYILPIALVGWFSKRSYALLLAICLPCTRLVFRIWWDVPWLVADTIFNALIRIAVFVVIAYLISFAKELHVLRGFLHICAYCHRIKETDGKWVPLEKYISDHSEAMLSHGICPECVPKFNKQPSTSMKQNNISYSSI